MATPFWTQSLSELETLFQTNLTAGLSKEDAAKRLVKRGPNELPKKGRVVWWKLLLSQFSSLIVWLLIAAAFIAGFLGEAIDAYAIFAIILLNALLGFIQEYRAESSIEALQELAAPNSKVIRSGILQTIPARELVPGDLILLEAGDRVPADGRIVDLASLSLDEASLTGESIPMQKTLEPLAADLPLADRENMVYMGTAATKGKGHVLITQTGTETEMGKIASGLLEVKREKTPLQNRLNSLGKKLVYLCLGIIGVVFALGVFRGMGWIEMILVSLSLAVAAIPEGLPAVVTIALSIGVRKMAAKKALIRRLSSVETLGSTSVICTDKTGTLTQNEMTVQEIWVDQKTLSLSGVGYSSEGEVSEKTEGLDWALTIGVLCNNANIYQEEGLWKVAGDPTEGALLTAAKKGKIEKSELEKLYPQLEEIPFDSDRKMMSILRKAADKKILFVKGAPDIIVNRAQKWLVNGEVKPIDREQILAANQTMAEKAYRVLAVAYQENMEAPLEEDLIFVALIGMIDPPRQDAKEAISLCKEAGIHTVMVTGDHKQTALAIGRVLEMDEGEALSGDEIEKLNPDEMGKITIFSRINAEDKLKIIQAYKEKGEIVAMTGDGVNDAPAMHAADIGVSMGITGTDVTKESSDMIILDDRFPTIVTAVKEGRGIYDNIVKFVGYLLAANVAEILVIFVAMLLGLSTEAGKPFIALLPVQLLWMNLVTDGFPAISLAMDPIDPTAMQRPPRPPREGILNRKFALYLFSLSILVTVGTLIACVVGLKTSSQMAQTLTFTTLIILELVKVHLVRLPYRITFFSNKYLCWALLSSFVLQLLVLYIPTLHPIFGVTTLSLMHWGLIALISGAFWLCGRILAKFFYKV